MLLLYFRKCKLVREYQLVAYLWQLVTGFIVVLLKLQEQSLESRLVVSGILKPMVYGLSTE